MKAASLKAGRLSEQGGPVTPHSPQPWREGLEGQSLPQTKLQPWVPCSPGPGPGTDRPLPSLQGHASVSFTA